MSGADWWVPVVAGFVGGLTPALVAWLAIRADSRERAKDREHQSLRDWKLRGAEVYADARELFEQTVLVLGMEDPYRVYSVSALDDFLSKLRATRSDLSILHAAATPAVSQAAGEARKALGTHGAAVTHLRNALAVFQTAQLVEAEKHREKAQATERNARSPAKQALEQLRQAISGKHTAA